MQKAFGPINIEKTDMNLSIVKNARYGLLNIQPLNILVMSELYVLSTSLALAAVVAAVFVVVVLCLLWLLRSSAVYIWNYPEYFPKTNRNNI